MLYVSTLHSSEKTTRSQSVAVYDKYALHHCNLRFTWDFDRSDFLVLIWPHNPHLRKYLRTVMTETLGIKSEPSPCSRALINGALLAYIHRSVYFKGISFLYLFANFNHIFCILLLHIPKFFDTCLWLSPSLILAITNFLSLFSILTIFNKGH